MVKFTVVRSLSLAAAFCSGLANFVLAVQVIGAYNSLNKLDLDSETERDAEAWQVKGGKLFFALLSTYFGTSTLVNILGFVGISKSIPSFVRFYRDFSIADFAVSTLFAFSCAYAAFESTLRTTVCEELARQPELTRSMVELGLSLENCELWFERAIWVFLGVMVIVSVIRAHLLIGLSNFYSQLQRRTTQPNTPLPLHAATGGAVPLQRIYLLPAQSSTSEEPVVYAPIAFSSLSDDMRAAATEAWVTGAKPHRQHRRHSETGRIVLSGDEERLLPDYYKS